MSHPSYYKMMRNIDININIIDYSEENIKYFEPYKNVFLFPPYFKFINNNNNNNNINNINNKIIDVLSIVNNNYRINMSNKINKKYNTLFINNCYDNVRDDYFDKSKIYINIHCSTEHKTMELIRIVNLIMKKVIVISEPSICIDLLYLKDYIIICNDFNDISTYIGEILNNYDSYMEKIYGNFDEKKYYSYIKMNFNKILFDI